MFATMTLLSYYKFATFHQSLLMVICYYIIQ